MALTPLLIPGPAPWRPLARIPAIITCAVVGGIVYGLHVVDTRMALLGYISTVPWLLLMLHPRLRGRGNAACYFAMMHLMALIGLYWLRGQSTATWLIAPLLYYPIGILTYTIPLLVRRRWPSFPLAVLWPIVFTGVEWFRIRVSPGELALCVLGYSQIVLTKVVQIADLFGVAAVTFLLAAFAGLFAEAWISLSTRPTWRDRARLLAPQAAWVVALAVGTLGYGVVRDTEANFTEGPRLHVLQPATGRATAVTEARRIHDLQVVQTLSTARPGQTEAILWPENSILLPFLTGDQAAEGGILEDMQLQAARLRLPILVDGWTQDPASGQDHHSSVLIQPDGVVQIYHKVRLLPWTEYVPMQGFFGSFGRSALDAWLGFVKSFVGMIPLGRPGDIDALRTFELATPQGVLRFGTPICFEIATPRVVNRWHQQGAHFLVNQTSEGRLGDTIHEMTIAISGFRAIEGRVSVVRATNEGISALIDPNGRVREVLAGRYTGSPINEPGVFYPTVILDSRRGTIYTRIGDTFAIGCFGVSIALALASVLPRRRPSGPVEVPSPA